MNGKALVKKSDHSDLLVEPGDGGVAVGGGDGGERDRGDGTDHDDDGGHCGDGGDGHCDGDDGRAGDGRVETFRGLKSDSFFFE